MNALLYSSIQTAAYGNLFECSTASVEIGDVVFSSMRHDNIVGLSDDGDALIFVSLLNTRALKTKFPDLACEEGLVIRHKANDLTDHIGLLGTLFRSAAELPRDPATVLPDRTERFATVKARLGQHRYKIKQADLWGNACAVTGIAEPSLLRASHAKPWSESTDAERVDPNNGFPLVAHLDALFDAGLISFSSVGSILISSYLDRTTIDGLKLSSDLCLRKLPTHEQEAYLDYHRKHIFKDDRTFAECRWVETAHDLMLYLETRNKVQCKRILADAVFEYCSEPEVSVEEDGSIVFVPAEFDTDDYEGCTDFCIEHHGSAGGVYWEVKFLGMVLQKVDYCGEWKVVERGILDRVETTYVKSKTFKDGRDVFVYDDEEYVCPEEAIEHWVSDCFDGNLDPEVTLRDVRSHEEDVEEVERQLSKIECDGFYEDGGEFYVWFDGNEPPWDGFDAGTDLCDIHDVAEVLVSEGED